jgi:hypothetical protein
MLITAQYDFQEIVTMLIKSLSSSASSWLYNASYHETYERLQQLDESIQGLANDVHNMKRIVKQNQSRIIDLNIVIYDLPVEQYMAIFGPLLFPLIVPLLITLVRERARYRKRRIDAGR